MSQKLRSKEKQGHLSLERWWHTARTPPGLGSQKPICQDLDTSWGEKPAGTPPTKVTDSPPANGLRAPYRHEVTFPTHPRAQAELFTLHNAHTHASTRTYTRAHPSSRFVSEADSEKDTQCNMLFNSSRRRGWGVMPHFLGPSRRQRTSPGTWSIHPPMPVNHWSLEGRSLGGSEC